MSVAGRIAPAASTDRMSDTAFGRPWQLEDRDWLARRYAEVGDRAIAKELGCAHSTVTAARRRLKITPAAEGRRRGDRPSAVSESVGKPAPMGSADSLTALADHFDEDHRTKAPATRDLLIARCRGWLDAERNHDQLATEDALLSIASAALLVHEHQLKLRKAA